MFFPFDLQGQIGGGFNPSEKSIVKIGACPQVGVKSEKYLSCHHLDQQVKQHPLELCESTLPRSLVGSSFRHPKHWKLSREHRTNPTYSHNKKVKLSPRIMGKIMLEQTRFFYWTMIADGEVNIVSQNTQHMIHVFKYIISSCIIIIQMVEELHQILLKLRTFFGTGKRKMQIEHLKDRGPKGLRDWGCPLQCMTCFFWGWRFFIQSYQKKEVSDLEVSYTLGSLEPYRILGFHSRSSISGGLLMRQNYFLPEFVGIFLL